MIAAKSKFNFVIALAVLFVISACSTVPITGRRQLNLVPNSLMNSMSLQAYNDFLSKNQVSQDAEKTSLVKGVGARIQAAVEQYAEQSELSMEGYDWEFNLIEDDTVNAWAMPGGKVVVYTGLLPVAQDDSGLAVVMGHEIAHAIAEHGSERMSQGLIVEMGGMALSQALAKQPALTKSLFTKSYGVGTQVGVLLPFSRKHESEADHLGLIFMAMAGYDPHVAVDFWQRMADARKSPEPPELLSTHPADEKRIERIKELLPDAMKYYQPVGQ